MSEGVQVKIKLTPAAAKLVADAQTLPDRVTAALIKEMNFQNVLTVSHIQTDYLDFPRGGASTPVGLRNMTGRYHDSLNASGARFASGMISSSIGSNVVSKGGVSYPAVHEFGATIPARASRAKKNKGKGVMIGERVLPAREPIQRGIADRADDYSEAFSAAIVKEWNK